MVADFVTDTNAFEVRGSSVEPVALDRQYLLAQPPKDELAGTLSVSDGKPAIAEDSEDCTYFKRFRVLDSSSVILESLDKVGPEEIVRLSTVPEQPDPILVQVREVVRVVFDKK